MELPNTLWLDNYISRSNRLCNREIGGINLPPLTSTTRRGLRSMLEGAVNIRCITSQLTRTTCDGPELGGLSSGAVKNVWVPLRDLVKHRLVKTEALGNDGLWSLRKPVIKVESSTEKCERGYRKTDITTYPALSKSASSKARRYSFSSSRPWTVWA